MTPSEALNVVATEQWVEEWSAEVDEQVGRSAELADRMSGLTSRAYSTDGAIEVTIDGAGILTDLKLGEQMSGWRPDEIAAEIMATLGKAHRDLTSRVVEAVEETVGAESASGRVVLEAIRAREPAEPAATSTWYAPRVVSPW